MPSGLTRERQTETLVRCGRAQIEDEKRFATEGKFANIMKDEDFFRFKVFGETSVVDRINKLTSFVEISLSEMS